MLSGHDNNDDVTRFLCKTKKNKKMTNKIWISKSISHLLKIVVLLDSKVRRSVVKQTIKIQQN